MVKPNFVAESPFFCSPFFCPLSVRRVFPTTAIALHSPALRFRPTYCSIAVSLPLYTPENRKMVIQRRGILEKFNRPRLDWPVFSEEFEQWAPAGESGVKR